MLALGIQIPRRCWRPALSTTIVTSSVPFHNNRRRRNFSGTSPTHQHDKEPKSSGERLRVAIVGGGAAGLSTALHLAPLVHAGHIESPIDVYDYGSKKTTSIGVGLWSTALYAFRDSKNVESHQIAYREMVQSGSFSEKVGFRSPKGDWLAGSNLAGPQTPDFLFLKESDMMSALRKACDWEVQKGTVVMHSSSKVESIVEDSPHPWSAPLLVTKGAQQKATEFDYHLIVAADGMNSILRKTYGGFCVDQTRLLGTNAMEKASDGPLLDLHDSGNENEDSPEMRNHEEAIGTQDRHYHVFRGNSPLTKHDVDGLEEAFQTWGESHNMRFATVPMEGGPDKEEKHTWFITIDDPKIASESDPKKRKELLLEAFTEWHDPIQQLVASTPSDEILMDRAVAHKHSCEPVVSFQDVVCKIRKDESPVVLTNGKGPIIQFVGDSFMTVDPILAQGFTFGMEGAAAMASSLKIFLENSEKITSTKHHLAFDPQMLRKVLLDRHDQRLDRLLCLLRSSELVQALGQPTEGSLSGWISRCILRPAMRLTPDFIKTPIFNRVMEYSLGLHTVPTKR